MYKKEMNKRLDKRSDLIDAFYDYPSDIWDQIVYLDPNESILPEVIEVINSFRYELTMSFENDEGEQDFLFTNGEQAILVSQSRKLGAIFIDTRGTDGVIEQVLTHKCLECFQKILWRVFCTPSGQRSMKSSLKWEPWIIWERLTDWESHSRITDVKSVGFDGII